MDILPILSTLRRHKTAAILIVVEIALSCAIVCNALFLIGDRLDTMRRPSGVAERELVRVQVAGIGRNANAEAITREDLAALRAIPGVRSVATSPMVPFGESTWNTSINLQPDQDRPSASGASYYGGEGFLETLGLELIAGRDFAADEYREMAGARAGDEGQYPPVAILSRALAERLFPGESALGRSIYTFGEAPIRVVGVVDRLLRPNPRRDSTVAEDTLIFPLRMNYSEGAYYLIRTDPDRRDEVLEAAVRALEAVNSSRVVIYRDTVESLRSDFYRQDRAMAWLLVTVCVALLVVTALGIVGLASFWVQQRTRQIGIRRALGATRGQIMRYFQTENFLLATLGIALGMLLAYGINLWLMQTYALPRLPLAFLPAGAIALWVLGQIAVLGPARRAARVPPAVATRSA
ncbi:ABC transporter permease [Coralloluteibacterium thermophilus]|uniref:ABC transporter permease n=1 Tax=Coralloluteibacterium thermophilum TaxID=2707049 RepID=A0ABV9NR83_9GAMM